MRLAIAVYNLFILLTFPAIVVFLVIQLLIHKRYRESLWPRLGFLSPGVQAHSSQYPVFWIHAVSVGEVIAVSPLVKRLRHVYPGSKLLVSTVTQTGQQTARQKIPEADCVFYLPFDVPWIVSRVLRKIRPALFVFLETEIWPGILLTLARYGIPSVMVNGRVSRRSYRGYQLLLPFFGKVLKAVSLFSVQTELDRERLMALGVDGGRVVKTGNMKYDQAVVADSVDRESCKKALKLPPSCDLIVAGSTHEGEEAALANCYGKLLEKHPSVRLLLAPRHLDRLERIEKALQHQAWTPVRKTKIESAGFSELPNTAIVLLDTLGELQRFYSIASLVFMGGSLVPVGGHNVLEPAAFAKPILFGPHMENYREIVQLLIGRQAAIQVADTHQLIVQMGWLLDHPDQPTRIGSRAREVVLEQQGAVEKTLKLIQGILKEGYEKSH